MKKRLIAKQLLALAKLLIAQEIGIGYSWNSKDGKREITEKTMIRGEERWVVKSEKQTFSALIPPDQIEKEIKLDEANFAFWQKQQKVKDDMAKAEAEANAKAADLDGFENKFNKMSLAKMLAAMNKQVHINGKATTRKEFIRDAVKNGAQVVPHAKDKRQLQLKSGSFFKESDLTKFALDYAEYLIKK